MKKKMKLNNSRFHRWTAIWLALVLVFGIFTAPVKVYANPYGGGDGNCTYTAWRLAYANTGIQLPGWGNAHTWYDSARNAGYTVSTVPRAKSIAVWKGGSSGYGHVAYVTEVSGNQIYIQEGGYNGAYHEGWENAYGQTKYYSSNLLTMIGYIYLGDTTPTIPSGYLDHGQSFNAVIIRTDVWKHITVNGDNVELSSENKPIAKQHWHFERQSDGSYIITSLYDGRALDVSGAGTANGTNVGVYQKWGTDNGAQRWYIYGNQTARRLVPKNAPNRCLDCNNDDKTAGTNIQIWELNQSGAQVFSIYEIEYKMPKRVDDKANYFLEVGETCPITATVEPADCGNRDLIYSVADPAIATVKDGKLTGIAPGSTTLTITSAYSDKLKCTVNVKITYGHHWGDWNIIQEADCENAGERQHTCENCGETETETIAALGHTVVIDKAVAATTSSTGLTKGSHCSVCGKVLEAQEIVPKLTKVTKPKAPTIKLTTKKRTVQIKISKVKGVSGYQIYRSRSKSSGYKRIASTKKTSYTNKGLTAKKTYYYKVRAYKTTKGKNVYGNWSKVQKIKVKK